MLNIIAKYRELILYGIIGASCALLDFGIYYALGFILPFLIANIISTHCGIFCSFYLNRKYNFKVKDKTFHRFVVFYAVGLLGLSVSEGALYVLINGLCVEELIAKLITIVIVALLQFLLNKYITFKSKQNG